MFSRWFLEPHCLVPHFLVRFAYSNNPSNSASSALSNPCGGPPAAQTPPELAAAAAGGAAAAAATGGSQDAARAASARQPREETEGFQGTKTAIQTQNLDEAPQDPAVGPAGYKSNNAATFQHSHSNTKGQDPHGVSPFLDLVKYAASSAFPGGVLALTEIWTVVRMRSCVDVRRVNC